MFASNSTVVLRPSVHSSIWLYSLGEQHRDKADWTQRFLWYRSLKSDSGPRRLLRTLVGNHDMLCRSRRTNGCELVRTTWLTANQRNRSTERGKTWDSDLRKPADRRFP